MEDPSRYHGGFGRGKPPGATHQCHPEKPVSTPRKDGKPTPAAKATKPAVVSPRRPRCPPYDVVQELKAKRKDPARSFEERLAKLDAQVERLSKRYEKKLKVSERLETRTPEEIARELEEVHKYQA